MTSGAMESLIGMELAEAARLGGQQDTASYLVHLCLPSSRSYVYYHDGFYAGGCWGWNSGPHANTLLTELSTLPLMDIFMGFIDLLTIV